jgi:hypothetical protein
MFENNEYMSNRSYTENMLENRELLMQFAVANELKLTNTMFTKHMGKLATYRIAKDNAEVTDEEINSKTHAQIDFVIVSHRWRNSITDVESDTRANLNTDHFPFSFTIRIKLKQIQKEGKPRPVYKPCDSTQQDDLNHELWSAIPTEQNNNRYGVIEQWLKQGSVTLPKAQSKNKNERFEFSYTSRETLDQRKKAAKQNNLKLFLTLNAKFTKSRRDDKKQRIIESVSKELDIRDR